MITFYELGKNGRLGNQLFQYAALRAASLRSGFKSKIPDISEKTWHGQKCLLDNFNIESEVLSNEELSSVKNSYVQTCKSTHYQGLLNEVKDNSNISGHFIHLDYFSDFKDEILNELMPRDHIVKKESQFIEEIRQNSYEVVSLHIRRGDHIDGTNPEFVSYFGDPFDKNLSSGRYMTNAIDFFESRKVKFLVFVGGSRSGDDLEDIWWALENFPKDKFIVSDSNDPVVDFARILSCDHNIVSYSSTYSLWASYLNKNKNKTVICPRDFWITRDVDSQNEKVFMADWVVM